MVALSLGRRGTPWSLNFGWPLPTQTRLAVRGGKVFVTSAQVIAWFQGSNEGLTVGNMSILSTWEQSSANPSVKLHGIQISLLSKPQHHDFPIHSSRCKSKNPQTVGLLCAQPAFFLSIFISGLILILKPVNTFKLVSLISIIPVTATVHFYTFLFWAHITLQPLRSVIFIS